MAEHGYMMSRSKVESLQSAQQHRQDEKVDRFLLFCRLWVVQRAMKAVADR